MRDACRTASEILQELAAMIEPGITTGEEGLKVAPPLVSRRERAG